MPSASHTHLHNSLCLLGRLVLGKNNHVNLFDQLFFILPLYRRVSNHRHAHEVKTNLNLPAF